MTAAPFNGAAVFTGSLLESDLMSCFASAAGDTAGRMTGDLAVILAVAPVASFVPVPDLSDCETHCNVSTSVSEESLDACAPGTLRQNCRLLQEERPR